MKSFIATVATVACIGQVNAFDFVTDIINPIKLYHETIDFPLTAPEAVKRHKAYYKPMTAMQRKRVSANAHKSHLRVAAQRERLGFSKLNHYNHLHASHHNNKLTAEEKSA